MEATTAFDNHPLVHDVNSEQRAKLSPVEAACKRIADWTGSPLALALAVIAQAIWIVVGITSRFDPFPFVFLLTCSNVLQLILIFVLAVGQRQSSSHAELRAEHDHDSISRLLYHQEVQESLLLAIASRIDVKVDKAATMVARLAGEISSDGAAHAVAT